MASLASLVPTVRCPRCYVPAASHHHNTCRACGRALSAHKGVARDALEAVDAAARRLADRPDWTPSRLAAELARCAPDPMGRARAAFTWIADHVAYDVAALASGRRSAEAPEEVLRVRKAVCAGYATTFGTLCERMGVRAEMVTGFVKGVGFEVGQAAGGSNHAWNVFEDEDGWHLLDATWGAGALEDGRFRRRFRAFYFDARPDRLVFTHLPDDPRRQGLAPPVSRAVFESLALPSSGLYTHSLGLDSHAEGTIRCGREITLSLAAACPVSVLYEIGGVTERGIARDRRILLPVVLPRPGSYVLNVFAHAVPCTPGVAHEQVLSYRLLWDR